AQLGGIRRVEERRLARVDDRPPTDRNVSVEAPRAGEIGRRAGRLVGRLDVDGPVHLRLDSSGAERAKYRLDGLERGERRVGEDRGAPARKGAKMLAGLGEDAGAERDRRRIDRESGLVALDDDVVAAGHGPGV